MDHEHFEGPQTIRDFNFKSKEMSKEIMRVCKGEKPWFPVSFNQSRDLRQILAKGVMLKEQKPPPKFVETLRPNLYSPNQLNQWKI